MADRAIGDLTPATEVTGTDLFVLEQNGVAKNVSGQVLENWLLSMADGHGGIKSIELAYTSGLVDAYRITYADGTSFDYGITNARSIVEIKMTDRNDAANVDTYTVYFNDGTIYDYEVQNGNNGGKGDKGDPAYVWIKYASQQPTAASHSFGDIPDNWIGIYGGNEAQAPTDWTKYTWFEFKGKQGDKGDPATLVSSVVEYQVGYSGTEVPAGAWSKAIPETDSDEFLWTRVTKKFNTGDPVVSYSVCKNGRAGLSLYYADVNAGSETTIEVMASKIRIPSGWRDPIVGDQVVTADGKIYTLTGEYTGTLYPSGAAYSAFSAAFAVNIRPEPDTDTGLNAYFIKTTHNAANADKTVAEIEEAYQAGNLIYDVHYYDGKFLRLPLISRVAADHWIFSGVYESVEVTVDINQDLVYNTYYDLIAYRSFYVTLTHDEETNTWTADKDIQEIHKAYINGCSMYCVMTIGTAQTILPLLAWDILYIFGGMANATDYYTVMFFGNYITVTQTTPPTPSWTAAEGEAGHILDRTHWVEPGTSTNTLTFDGDVTGLEVVDGMVKVSDTVVSVADLVGGVLEVVSLDESSDFPSGTVTLTEDLIMDMTADGAPMITMMTGNDDVVAVVVTEDYELDGTLLEKGIWFWYSAGAGYVSSLTITEALFGVPEIVHKLDNKYLDLDWTPKVEYTETEILPEAEYACNSAARVDVGDFEFQQGVQYIVNWDGVTYKLTAVKKSIMGSEVVFIGNTYMYTQVDSDNTGEPFVMVALDGYLTIYPTEVGAYTVKVTEVTPKYNQAPAGYIPGDYMPEWPSFNLTDLGLPQISTGESVSITADMAGLRSALRKGPVEITFDVLMTHDGLKAPETITAIVNGLHAGKTSVDCTVMRNRAGMGLFAINFVFGIEATTASCHRIYTYETTTSDV